MKERRGLPNGFECESPEGVRFYSVCGWIWRLDRRRARSELPVGSLSGHCACEHNGNKIFSTCGLHAEWLRKETEALNTSIGLLRMANKELYDRLEARDTALDMAHFKNADLLRRLDQAEFKNHELERKQFVGAV